MGSSGEWHGKGVDTASEGRTLVLLNPNAGAGKARRAWGRLESRWPELTGTAPDAVDWLVTPDTAEAHRQLFHRLSTGSYGTLIAVGGDGTAHSAVNGLLGSGRAADVGFGLVPAGTGSDFARGLGLPKTPEAALARAFRGLERRVDVIEVKADDRDPRYCLNIASAGLSGAVGEVVNAGQGSGNREWHGSYLWETLRGLLRFEPREAKVWADGELVVDGPFFLVVMANGRYFGKGMKVAPGAKVGDGFLELVHVPPIPLWQLPWLLPRFLSGRHGGMKQVASRRVKTVRIEPSDGFYPYDLDGETLAASPASFRVLPGALRLLG